MLRPVLLLCLLCLLPLVAGEAWLRAHLFDHVSYSNSDSIDRQLRTRDEEVPWNMIFVGDSEVRWGLDPRALDDAFHRAGVPMKSFNHAFDGFGASWWPRILPALLREPSLRQVDTVAVGVQLTDLHRVVSATGADCGALQRPVLTSPFAVDLGLDGLCRDLSWDAHLGRRVFDGLWSVRYASSVRSLLLPQSVFTSSSLRMNSRSMGPPIRGFQPHRTLAEDRASYDDEFRRWKAQFRAENLQPLRSGDWDRLVADGGFFDQLREPIRAAGRRLVLFALPTNPVTVDTFQRRGDYERNSRLLREWAARRGVVFVDLGLQDRPDADTFFSDMRHLSHVGAHTFSDGLGTALARTFAGTGVAK